MEGHGFSRAVSDVTNAPLGAEGKPPGAYEYSRILNWIAVIALALGGSSVGGGA